MWGVPLGKLEKNYGTGRYITSHPRRNLYFDSGSLPELQEQSNFPEETLISEELFALYVKDLDRLPERCRDIVTMCVKKSKITHK